MYDVTSMMRAVCFASDKTKKKENIIFSLRLSGKQENPIEIVKSVK